MFGWSQLVIIRTSPAAGLALVSAEYLDYFIPLPRSVQMAVAAGIIILFGAFNYVGVRWASLYQRISTTLKVGGLALFVILGFILVQGQANRLGETLPPAGNLGPIGNIVAALMLILFAHSGYERLGYVAGEMKNARRAIPRSLIVGILLVILLYVSVNMIYHWTLGLEGVRANRAVATRTAEILMGGTGALFVAVLVILSSTGSINGTIMAATRVYYAMARDRLFFRWLDHIHPKFRTPTRAIIAHCFWAIVILLVRGTFKSIAAGMVFVLLIFYSLSAVALFKLRAKEEGEAGAFRVPLFPVIPAVFLAGMATLLVLRIIFDLRSSLIDLAFVASGLPFSFFWMRKAKGYR